MGDYDKKIGENEMTTKKKNDAKYDTFMIWRGDVNVLGVADKVCTVKIISGFMKDVLPGTEVFDGRNIIAVKVPRVQGDRTWMKDNVFKYVELVGAMGDDAVRSRIERAKALYDAARGDNDYVDGELLRYYLDQRMMKYDVWGDDDGQEA